jgi:asparagine N-glycosylation enzyme membrane subunit Stt3
MDLKSWIKKNYWILLLIAIFLFSYWIRAFNIIPDRILSFDPTFQYRFTKYIADWGHIPLWDELTYYTGRLTNQEVSPLMLYATVFAHNILKNFNFSLLTTASYMSAIYGALLTIPAFFLIKRLAGEKAGLLGAFLIGTAPQILIRTFGSSYDTDQVALFFILLNLYLGLRFLQNKSIANFCWMTISLLASILAWGLSIYAFLIIVASSFLYLILQIFLIESENRRISKRLKKEFSKYKNELVSLIGIFTISTILGSLLKLNIIESILAIIGFATKPEKWIVNISIAELQPFNIFNLNGWMMATGRFITGDKLIDTILTITIISFTLIGLFYNYKKDNRRLSFLVTIFCLGIYTTFRGIRFTEFSSILFLIIIASGFGYLLKLLNKDKLLKGLALGIGILFAFSAMSMGIQYGQNLGPDQNQNWETAWEFLRTQTPEDSIVGTWWDPGHMIAALAERRDFADGAHCGTQCMYNINNRITDLGKIMATSSEQESLELIRKYKGTSSKVYWIASNDLISKYQWLQYFGTGCDATKDPSCQLYQLIPQQQALQNENSEIIVRIYSNIIIVNNGYVNIPIYTQNNEGFIFNNILLYDQSGKITSAQVPESQVAELNKGIAPIMTQLGITMSDKITPTTIWISKDMTYVVMIPDTLKNTIFTKMFFLEGQGLQNFKQVFRNEQVKIYEVIV